MEIYIRQTPYLVQGHVKVIYVNEFNIYELCVCQRRIFPYELFNFYEDAHRTTI